MAEVKTPVLLCEVRSKTGSPCHRRAVVEIGGVAFCGPCAREQEAYFAIGGFTQEEARDLHSKSLADVLERMRRDRAGSTDLSLDADTVVLA